ncbi:MAG: hypothetical protein RW306_03765 [Geobacteraceae bacterium]|nr:hypothetical protein [Geobacteraceae bacterium]
MSPETINTISILSGVFSIAISVIAIALSIAFYLAGRKTEISVSNSLTKIEAQTDALQKLSGRQIDKLMKHAFDNSGQSSSTEAMTQIVSVLSQMPLTITAMLKQPSVDPNKDDLVISLYAALYFYTAQTNYWSQYYLPKAVDFDPTNENHALIKRMVDLSDDDFRFVAETLTQFDPTLLANNMFSHLINETKETWRHAVKSSADVFVANSQS